MAQDGVVNGNNQNTVHPNKINSHSNFDLSRHVFGTYRFGEIGVLEAAELVKNDKFPLRSRSNVRSYTMKSPLMQDVQFSKDSFVVPMEAILPFNWEKLYTNPVIGDDVDASKVGTTVTDFAKKLNKLWRDEQSRILAITHDSSNANNIVRDSLRLLVIGEAFWSYGSLMSSLGYRISTLGRMVLRDQNGSAQKDRVSYDRYFDLCIANMMKLYQYIVVSYGGTNYTVWIGEPAPSYRSYEMPLRQLLEIMREDVTSISVVTVSWKSGVTPADNYPLLDAPSSTVSQIPDYWNSGLEYTQTQHPSFPVNLARLWAYQLVVAHYYSNDHVDFVYSAELFRENIFGIIQSYGFTGNSFSYNGISTFYDYLSAYYIDRIITNAAGMNFNACYRFIQCLLSFRHSLRYKDYFVGSRVAPLAIGNVDAPVNSSNAVSAIDTTRSIMMQRFLNAVNRAGRKFSNYLEELFPGGKPAQDYHNPIYLGHTADTVYTVETENTGVAQMSQANSVTSIFRSNAERFIFEYRADRPCVVLTLITFDVTRAYISAMERQLFHRDRFDMFNPFMQYLGDQRVYEAELVQGMSGASELANTFGYQTRHEEYKQRFNTCFGGFVENLPGYLFKADVFSNADAPRLLHQNPLFIRASSVEFDDFFVSLTGYALASYFHFMMDNFNMVDASRPMAYNPQIL